jgi:hypothetical protein
MLLEWENEGNLPTAFPARMGEWTTFLPLPLSRSPTLPFRGWGQGTAALLLNVHLYVLPKDLHQPPGRHPVRFREHLV